MSGYLEDCSISNIVLRRPGSRYMNLAGVPSLDEALTRVQQSNIVQAPTAQDNALTAHPPVFRGTS